MSVRKMSETVVVDLAKRFGIRVKWVNGIDIPECYEGPMGQGCDPARKRVFFEKKNDWAEVEHYLHELVHVIVQPPWWSINDCPEEFILFQYERALARALLEDWAVERVIDWQHETAVAISGRYVGDLCLRDMKPYENKPWWRAGFKFCRMLGLLDERNRPTFEWPRWEVLTPYAAAIRSHYESQARTPLPRLVE